MNQHPCSLVALGFPHLPLSSGYWPAYGLLPSEHLGVTKKKNHRDFLGLSRAFFLKRKGVVKKKHPMTGPVLKQKHMFKNIVQIDAKRVYRFYSLQLQGKHWSIEIVWTCQIFDGPAPSEQTGENTWTIIGITVSNYWMFASLKFNIALTKLPSQTERIVFLPSFFQGLFRPKRTRFLVGTRHMTLFCWESSSLLPIKVLFHQWFLYVFCFFGVINCIIHPPCVQITFFHFLRSTGFCFDMRQLAFSRGIFWTYFFAPLGPSKKKRR